MLHELGDVLVKEGEGRVGDDDVRLFQERDALGAAEVAAGVLVVAFKAIRVALFASGRARRRCRSRAVSVLIFHLVDLDGERLGLWRLPLPSSYSGNNVSWPAMGEPS